MFDLARRHILVTGASSGLGEAFARLLAGQGADVTLAARRTELLARICADLAEAAGRVQALALDVTDAASVAACFEAAEAEFGPVRGVVNNAGVTVEGRAERIAEADWDRAMAVDLKGVWLTATEAARRMIGAGQGGTIVNIASILGERVATGVTPYAVAKAGVVQMTKALALEWARHGIRVNALAPGYFRTDLNANFFDSEAGKKLIRRIPFHRLGTAGELGGPLVLLLSDASSFMTGSVLAVDGGHLVNTL